MVDKTRATTIQQKFGFKDEDLRTPGHDEMMLWVDSHAADILGRFVKDIEEANEPAGVDKTIWEAPVMSGNYIVGFVDLLIEYSRDVHAPSGYYTKNGTSVLIERSYGFKLCIEIKTSIPSLGELIRQIRMYQEYQKGIYVVVSPDARFADALRSQGIEFYHYAPDPADVAMI